MASIGARSIAHRPQPAIPIQSITTRNLFRSESSIMRSIIVASPKTRARIRARAQTGKRRTLTHLWVEIPQLSSNEEHFNQRHQCVVPKEWREGLDSQGSGSVERRKWRRRCWPQPGSESAALLAESNDRRKVYGADHQ